MSSEKCLEETIYEKQLSKYIKAYGKAGMRTCPVCGKEFYAYSSDCWGYCEGKMFFCSYHCIRSYDKNPEIIEKGKGCNKKGQVKFPTEKQQEIKDALYKNYLLPKPKSLIKMAKELGIGRTSCTRYYHIMIGEKTHG